MAGWIKLHRDITDHWIWKNPSYLKGWITILLTVNFEDKKVLIESEIIECKRGQALLSIKSWAKVLGNGWTPQRVRTFLNLLQDDSMINMEGLRKTTRITVSNYELYQDLQQTNNEQTTSKQRATNKQVTTTKEGIKNIYNNIYSQFYNEEILKANNDEDYLRIIKVLYGENDLGLKLDSVLKMKYQLTYEQSKKIMGYKSRYGISISNLLEEMENWDNLKKRNSVYKTFLTFMNNKYPQTKEK